MKQFNFNQFTTLAEAYGTGTYDCGSYTDGCTTTQQSGGGILAPDTGLFAQPPIILYPSILLIGVIIGTLSFLISRQIKKLRKQS